MKTLIYVHTLKQSLEYLIPVIEQYTTDYEVREHAHRIEIIVKKPTDSYSKYTTTMIVSLLASVINKPILVYYNNYLKSYLFHQLVSGQWKLVRDHPASFNPNLIDWELQNTLYARSEFNRLIENDPNPLITL